MSIDQLQERPVLAPEIARVREAFDAARARARRWRPRPMPKGWS